MHADELFQAGRLGEAIDTLGIELRESPLDAHRRSFLFELLAFAGEHDRAARQLDVLGQASPTAQGGALFYKSALHADRERREMFERGTFPSAAADEASDDRSAESPPRIAGTLNGRRFLSIADADPRIGARLEVYAAGQYLLLPFAHVTSVRTGPPRQLRDLLWMPAVVQTSRAFRGRELGEVLLPVMTPLASTHPNDLVRLGRLTEWRPADGGEVPVGRKLLLVDDEEVPLLDVRELTIDAPAAHDA
jgi:type VI secretion system protein ImpE